MFREALRASSPASTSQQGESTLSLSDAKIETSEVICRFLWHLRRIEHLTGADLDFTPRSNDIRLIAFAQKYACRLLLDVFLHAVNLNILWAKTTSLSGSEYFLSTEITSVADQVLGMFTFAAQEGAVSVCSAIIEGGDEALRWNDLFAGVPITAIDDGLLLDPSAMPRGVSETIPSKYGWALQRTFRNVPSQPSLVDMLAASMRFKLLLLNPDGVGAAEVDTAEEDDEMTETDSE